MNNVSPELEARKQAYLRHFAQLSAADRRRDMLKAFAFLMRLLMEEAEGNVVTPERVKAIAAEFKGESAPAPKLLPAVQYPVKGKAPANHRRRRIV